MGIYCVSSTLNLGSLAEMLRCQSRTCLLEISSSADIEGEILRIANSKVRGTPSEI